tara:strand:- start:426 stop:692 length:267 start_codon:yes stop_codon:yes gene_type:complete
MTIDLRPEEFERYKQELARKKANPVSNNVEPKGAREPVCRFLGKIDEVVQAHERELDSDHQSDLVSYRGLPGFGSIKKWLFSNKKKGG